MSSLDPSIILAITTCPRPQQASYFEATFESILKNGSDLIDHKIVLSDGPFPHPQRSDWKYVIRTEGPTSVRNNLWDAFRYAHMENACRLLYFEDDIELCRNAIRRMATITIPPDVAFMSFHDVKEAPPLTPAGIYRVPAAGRDGNGFWGAQAMVFPQRTLAYLAPLDPFEPRRWRDSWKRHGDRVLEHYVGLSPWPHYAVHIPCLVKHLGEISIAHPGKPLQLRPTSNWRGAQYNALSSPPGPCKELTGPLGNTHNW